MAGTELQGRYFRRADQRYRRRLPRLRSISLMNELKKQGIAVMFVSSEMPEVMGVADRIIVMCDGRITGEVAAEEATQNEISDTWQHPV